MEMTIVLQGGITPAPSSPLATAPMKPDYEANTSDKYSQGDKNTARLPRMSYRVGDQYVYGAYFPAAGIRGKWRRLGRDVMAEYLAPWNIEDHRAMTIGGVKGSGSEASIDLDGLRRLREQNPLQSLFGQSTGFGQSWLAGKLSVGFAMPEVPLQVPDIITGIRSDDLKRNASEITYLTPDDAGRFKAMAIAERRYSQLGRSLKKLEASIKTLKSRRRKTADEKAELEALEQEKASLQEEQESLKESIGSDVSAQMPLSGYEVIPPGLRLNNRIMLRGVNDIEFGLFLRILGRFAMEPIVGAHIAHGCGVVGCDWDVIRGGEVIGHIQIDPFVNLQIEGDELKELSDKSLSAFKAWNGVD